MSPHLEHKNRLYTLIGVALAMFLGALDQTIVSTAMPRIVAELSGLERYTWVTTVYLLVSTLLVPIYGKLSDIRNRKGLQIWSVTVFLIGSALCGLAGEWGSLPLIGDGMNQLILFRGIQGLGGAGIFALAFIIVSDLYPPRERGKISGVFGAVFGLSSILGPLVGGYLTDHAGAWLPPIEGWRWVFYVNLPIGILALAFIIRKMPHLHPKDSSHKLDYVSAGLMLATFLPIILGLQLDKNTWAWDSPLILSLLLGGAAIGIGWVAHSLKTAHPILNLRLFGSRIFATGTGATFLFGASFMAIIIFLPLYMVNVQGVSATSAGASVTPLSLGIVLGAGLSGALVSKLGKYKGIMIAGVALTALAALLLSTLGVDSPYWLVVLYMFLAGVGFGPSQSVYALAIQNAVKPAEIGQATSAIQFTRQIGSTVGAALLGVVFSTTLGASFAANMPKGGGDMGGGGARSQLAAQGPKEIRAGFDHLIAAIDPLFALRGEEAARGLERLENDPAFSEDMRAQVSATFKDGTPAMRMEKAFAAYAASLKAPFLAGDATGVAAVLEAGARNPDGSPGPAAGMPDAARAMIVRLAGGPAAAREASWRGIESQLAGMLASVEDRVSAQAAEGAKKGLAEARDGIISGIRASFSAAVVRVWTVTIFILLGMLLVTLFIPSIPLRGKGEHPAGEVAPAGH